MKPADANRPLDPGYTEFESGYGRFDDGQLRVAVWTTMFGCPGRIVEWWFGYRRTTEQYNGDIPPITSGASGSAKGKRCHEEMSDLIHVLPSLYARGGRTSLMRARRRAGCGTRGESAGVVATGGMMTTMRAVQVSAAGGPLEMVERPVPEPPVGAVRIRVQACGICHSDSVTKDGLMPGLAYPRVPGHEVAGVIDALGRQVEEWTVGQRVGVGWHGGSCGRCDACRRGEMFACHLGRATGVTHDGGYAEHMIAPASALALIPDSLTAAEAAPLLCAGVTTFNALRHSGARPGDVVAIHGLGGLGHLGVQYAAKMGFHTVAIARGGAKESLAMQLGAARYVDSEACDPAAALLELGGARAILATVTSGAAMSAVQGGLGLNGTMLLIGVPESMTVSPQALLRKRASVRGWYSGTAIDSQDALAFSARHGIRSMNEPFPLARAGDAYERMMSGAARFRVVLTMGP